MRLVIAQCRSCLNRVPEEKIVKGGHQRYMRLLLPKPLTRSGNPTTKRLGDGMPVSKRNK